MIKMFRPRQVILSTNPAEPGIFPWAAIIPDRFVRQSGIDPRDLGYRIVCRRPEIGGGSNFYARPWIVWAWLRLQVLSRYKVFYPAFDFLWMHGVLHLKPQPPGMLFRWRDIRLGKSHE